LKSSHVNSKVNDQFLEWLEKMYASNDIGHVKAICGNRHDYLAMILDFLIPGVLQIHMTQYLKSTIEEFPDKLSGKTKTPWNQNLFKVDPTSKCLKTKQAIASFLHICNERNVPLLQAWMPGLNQPLHSW
jgi:hypothetical protein